MPGSQRLADPLVARIVRLFGLAEVTDWGVIAAGTINDNHWLAAGGQRWFVRLNRGKSEADVEYEAKLVQELVTRGVRTPCPRQTLDACAYGAIDGELVSVFPWQAGAHREGPSIADGDARAVGTALAELHLAGEDLAGRFARKGIYTTEHIAARHRQLTGDSQVQSDSHLGPAIELAGDELAWLGTMASVRQTLPTGIIHGDLFADNVLFDDAGRPVLLDFEQASVGSWMYDLAVCVNAWTFAKGDEWRRDLASAVVAGYCQGRQTSRTERELLWVELRASAVRFLITRITDVYLPGQSLPGKGFESYQARLLHWRSLGASEAGSLWPD